VRRQSPGKRACCRVMVRRKRCPRSIEHARAGGRAARLFFRPTNRSNNGSHWARRPAGRGCMAGSGRVTRYNHTWQTDRTVIRFPLPLPMIMADLPTGKSVLSKPMFPLHLGLFDGKSITSASSFHFRCSSVVFDWCAAHASKISRFPDVRFSRQLGTMGFVDS